MIGFENITTRIEQINSLAYALEGAMIEAAGLGVGVANVTDDVRPFCDAVLRASADDGAIAEVVERFILAS